MQQTVNARSVNATESRAFSILRVFAILSVIAAHVNRVVEMPAIRGAISAFWNAFGQVGVICFFLMGGFFYHRERGDTKSFWQKKLTSLIIPWIFCSIITFALNALSARSFSVLAYVKWVLGSGTWYYYITVFLIFLVIFKWLARRDAWLYLCMVLNIASLALCTVKPDWLSLPFLTQYLNVFNWIGFFALGILMRKYRLDRAILSRWWSIPIAAVAAIASLAYHMHGFLTYFHLVTPIFELSAFVLLLWASNALAKTRVASPLAFLGGTTYCIYLLHMQIVQTICRLLPQTASIDIINPFIGLTVMAVAVTVGLKICQLLPFGKVICTLVGLRAKK